MSLRPVLPSAPSESGDPLLDAAYTTVMAVGVRRTTMSDVARRAGVSRQTAYRRHPDVASLISSLMTREFARVFRMARAAADAEPTARERVAAAVADGCERLAAEPLFVRILDVDPELLLPYVFERLGGVQKLVIDALARDIEHGVSEGSIRAESPQVLGAMVELLARGALLGAHAEREDEFDAWPELRLAIDAYLRPAA